MSIFYKTDADLNVVGIFRNSGSVAPFDTDSETLYECCNCTYAPMYLKEAVWEREHFRRVWHGHIDKSYDYTLDELKYRINVIADQFLKNNDWDGGPYPEMLSNNYADGARTYDELYALVKEMKKGLEQKEMGQPDDEPENVVFERRISDKIEHEYQNKDGSDKADWSTLKNNAEATFAQGGGDLGPHGVEVALRDKWDTDYIVDGLQEAEITRVDYNEIEIWFNSDEYDDQVNKRRDKVYVWAEHPDEANLQADEVSRQFYSSNGTFFENSFTLIHDTGMISDGVRTFSIGEKEIPPWPELQTIDTAAEEGSWGEKDLLGYHVWDIKILEEPDFTHQ